MKKHNPILISLNDIIEKHNSSLLDFMKSNYSKDYLIFWNVKMMIKDKKTTSFFVCLAVCWSNLEVNDVKNIFLQIKPNNSFFIFSHIQANNFNKKSFGIYIEENNFGDKLTNSLVNEVIEKSKIEETLIQKNIKLS